jgi:hypothetical protein
MSISDDSVVDASIAASTLIMENLAMLPADRGRCEAFFFEVVHAAILAALQEDRTRRTVRETKPSRN